MMSDAHFRAMTALIDEVARLRGRTPEFFAPVYAATGLTEIEMTVLNAVACADTPPTVPRIGRSLGHPRQVIQRAANALLERGLIAAHPNPDHKRAVLLAATPSGRALKRKADVHAARLAGAVIGATSQTRMRHAVEVVRDLRIAIENAIRTTSTQRTRRARGVGND